MMLGPLERAVIEEDQRLSAALCGDKVVFATTSTERRDDYTCLECGGGVVFRQACTKHGHISGIEFTTRAHFVHVSGDRHGCGEGATHKAAKKLLQQSLDSVRFWSECCICGKHDTVHVPPGTAVEEHPFAAFRADVAVLDDEENMVACVEVHHTNPMSDSKINFLSANNIPWVEVDAVSVVEMFRTTKRRDIKVDRCVLSGVSVHPVCVACKLVQRKALVETQRLARSQATREQHAARLAAYRDEVLALQPVCAEIEALEASLATSPTQQVDGSLTAKLLDKKQALEYQQLLRSISELQSKNAHCRDHTLPELRNLESELQTQNSSNVELLRRCRLVKEVVALRADPACALLADMDLAELERVHKETIATHAAAHAAYAKETDIIMKRHEISYYNGMVDYYKNAQQEHAPVLQSSPHKGASLRSVLYKDPGHVLALATGARTDRNPAAQAWAATAASTMCRKCYGKKPLKKPLCRNCYRATQKKQ